MMTPQRTAKATRDKQFVAWFAAGAAHPACLFDKAGDAYGNNRRAFYVACLATDDGDLESARCLIDAPIELLHPRNASVRWNDQRHEREPRHAGHRGKVARGPRHRFPTNQFRAARLREVDSFHEAI